MVEIHWVRHERKRLPAVSVWSILREDQIIIYLLLGLAEVEGNYVHNSSYLFVCSIRYGGRLF